MKFDGRYLLGGLVSIYLAVSVIAYTDYPRTETEEPLTADERRGLEIWRENNCQACHQLHGFGGFLGPDLTNRMTDEAIRYEHDYFMWILDDGYGRMPAFELPREDRAAVIAFLRRMDRSGQAQPDRLASGRTVPRLEHPPMLVAAWEEKTGREVHDDVQAGCEQFVERRCASCHVLFDRGKYRSPDLTGGMIDRSEEGLAETVREGRSMKMPAYPLSDEEVRLISTFLEWVADRRAEMVEVNDALLEREEFRWSEVPWWEYR